MSENNLTLQFKGGLPLPLRFALGIALTVALSLLVFYMIMSPPLSDLGLMALFLSITAIFSLLAGYLAYRLGWMHRSPTLIWTLLGGYGLASALTFVNVWVTAKLMFFDQHDLLLATVLLLFAGAIAMALGYLLSAALTERIRLLDRAAHTIAGGRYDVQATVTGRDEIATLADSFNRMARRLQEADQKKRELDQLRRDLIAWVSHDLQTPLASLRAIIEALADGVVEDPEAVQRYLHTASREVEDLSTLIDDLFQMAQLDAGGLPLEREPAYVSDLISDTLEGFSVIAKERGITLQGKASPGIDPIWIDTQRIGRALNNLVSNALRHTPAGGSISLNAIPARNGILVEVVDTGEGIPEEDLPYIFERFYRGEKSRNRLTGGAGLGLAIARGIVEAHGGEMGVESGPDQGTRFFFTLPTKRP